MFALPAPEAAGHGEIKRTAGEQDPTCRVVTGTGKQEQQCEERYYGEERRACKGAKSRPTRSLELRVVRRALRGRNGSLHQGKKREAP